jgi:hypothetical protein
LNEDIFVVPTVLFWVSFGDSRKRGRKRAESGLLVKRFTTVDLAEMQYAVNSSRWCGSLGELSIALLIRKHYQTMPTLPPKTKTKPTENLLGVYLLSFPKSQRPKKNASHAS